VDTLSQFAKIPLDYMQARVDTHKTIREPQHMDLDSLSMPVLETMTGEDGLRRAETERRPAGNAPRTAYEVYDRTQTRGAILQPSPVAQMPGSGRRPSEAMGEAATLKVRPDLNWYDEYRKQREEGKWGPDEEVKKETELKSVLSDRTGRGYSLGGEYPENEAHAIRWINTV
jgi:hypothetical protein